MRRASSTNVRRRNAQSADSAWRIGSSAAEIASVRHQESGTNVATWSHAYYVQVAYRLPGTARLWKPYYRFEHVGVNAADDAFATIPRLDASTLGVRVDLSLFAAVKGEYRTWTRGSGSLRNHGGFFQMCFTF